MVKELICESCGKAWKVDYHSALTVRVQGCKECGTFKFQLEPLANKSEIPLKR